GQARPEAGSGRSGAGAPRVRAPRRRAGRLRGQAGLMRHAVLGVGGVGGLIGAALARGGAEVVLLMRPEALARYGGRLRVAIVVLGDFEVDCPAVGMLDREVDAVWVTTKATQLEAALELLPPDQ